MSEFAIEMDVRWGDVDSFGHVNNAVYLTYLEQVRTLWLENIGCELENPESGPVVANVNLNYRQVLNWPGRIEVTLKPDSPGRSSMKLHSEIRGISDDKDVQPPLYADGTVTVVWVDKKTGESMPLPSKVRAQSASE